MKPTVSIGAGAIVAVVALAAIAFVVVRYRAGAERLVTKTLNPASDENIVYQGANKIVQDATGDPNTTVGTWLYDVLPPVKLKKLLLPG